MGVVGRNTLAGNTALTVNTITVVSRLRSQLVLNKSNSSELLKRNIYIYTLSISNRGIGPISIVSYKFKKL